MTKQTLGDRVGDLEVCMGKLEQKVSDLAGWQKAQNGTVRDVRELIIKVVWLNIAQLTAVITFAYWFGVQCGK